MMQSMLSLFEHVCRNTEIIYTTLPQSKLMLGIASILHQFNFGITMEYGNENHVLSEIALGQLPGRRGAVV